MPVQNQFKTEIEFKQALLDYFAGQIASGLINDVTMELSDIVSKNIYKLATAMIKNRTSVV